jgi:hypothetical protein
MFILTRFKLADQDKKITRLLRESKYYLENKNKDKYKMSIDDVDFNEQWIKEVETFISIVWAEKKLKKILLQKELKEEDLFIFFILQTIATMPNPIFKTGPERLSHTLVGSAMYQEIKKQLNPCLQSLGQYDVKEEQVQFGHRYASDVMSFALDLKFAHELAYGEITLEEAL